MVPVPNTMYNRKKIFYIDDLNNPSFSFDYPNNIPTQEPKPKCSIKNFRVYADDPSISNPALHSHLIGIDDSDNRKYHVILKDEALKSVVA